MQNDSIRDKIIDGLLEKEDCDNEETYEFLQFLVNPNSDKQNRIFKPIETEDWEKVMRKAKKKSTSSIFSKRTYSVYKCALGCERMTWILVSFYNIIIKEQYYP